MLETLVAAALVVVALIVGLIALVALPFILVGGLLKLLIMLILLPFRALGVVFGAVGTVLAGLGKLVLFLLFVCFLPLVLLGGALLLPLLPVLLVVGLIWLLARAARPRPSAPAVRHGPGVSTA
jgi:hypothetical protein